MIWKVRSPRRLLERRRLAGDSLFRRIPKLGHSFRARAARMEIRLRSKLFGGRMIEATDLDREERKAQLTRQQSSSRGSSKPEAQAQSQSKSSQGQSQSHGYSTSRSDSYQKGNSNSGRSQSQHRGKKDSHGKFP